MAGNLPFETGTKLLRGPAVYGKVRPTPDLDGPPANRRNAETCRVRSENYNLLALTCTGKTGQFVTYTDEPRNAGVPQKRSFLIVNQ